jgi:hypothetical protein
VQQEINQQQDAQNERGTGEYKMHGTGAGVDEFQDVVYQEDQDQGIGKEEYGID